MKTVCVIYSIRFTFSLLVNCLSETYNLYPKHSAWTVVKDLKLCFKEGRATTEYDNTCDNGLVLHDNTFIS